MTDYMTDKVVTAVATEKELGRKRQLQARDLAVDTYRELLTMSPSDGIVWISTARDLVELTHEVWLTGLITDESGRQMTFKKMVHHIFNILHAREPASPTGVVNTLRNRKCMKTLPVLERYANIMMVQQMANPMLKDLHGWRKERRYDKAYHEA